MGSKTSTTSNNTGGKNNVKQASSSTKDAGACGRGTLKMVQNAILVWLDKNIDDNNEDCRNTITQLRCVLHSINKFTNGDECIQFIEDFKDEKACMIISGVLGQDIVPRVHEMSQVHSIFIFCSNKKFHKKWAKKWPKIKGVFTEIKPICKALKQASQQCEQNAISISFVATSGDVSSKNLDRLDPMFMYTQIMKEILLTIKFDEGHINQFIDYCRDVYHDDANELKNVEQLKREYQDQTSIWWYTCECFLYPMLNRALRTTDVDIIIKMGFFIGELHRHIEKLHKEQFGGHDIGNSFTVYRGQALSTKDFETLKDTKGGLLSFNNFLSTSKDQTVSLPFAHSALADPNSVGILFVMTIDPSKSTTPFASINDVSYFQTEGEILFSMHTVFRIGKIQSMNKNHRLFQVNLILTGEDDQDLRGLTDRIREETDPDAKGWYRLGLVLHKMGRFDKAQEVYEALLDQTTDERAKASIYHQIAWAKDEQGEYKEAITFYEKSLEIKQRTLPPNHLNFASTYNNIGSVYYSMGEYPKALSSYEKALEIRKQSLPPNHPDLAASYNNIGLVYEKIGNYPKAISSHEKALEIKKQSLPPNHPGLAASYNNISLVYEKIGEYPKALSSHEKALEIKKQSLPPNHPGLAASYNNIGLVHEKMGNYPKALSSHEKALEIRKQSLPPNHPDLAMSYNNIGNMYYSMGDYPKALSSHEKALEVRKQSLPPNHPDLAMSYNNIGNVYYNMGDYPKALSSHEKALEIKKQSLPPNHPDLAASYNNIGMVYEKIGDYSKAQSLYECAVNIGQQSLLSNHPNRQTYRNNHDRIKKKL
jgi:tetratricopeptide (TPR) repeat protein